jgi:ribosomal-protein-alanine N-acetyltransferase
MVSERRSFQTDRLIVDEWHAASLASEGDRSLADIVASLMTASVTRPLPSEWQGEYTRHRAKEWIAQRDHEGPTLLAVERSSRLAVGLVILLETEVSTGSGVDIRLGYVLAEAAWGRGIGSELVGGFVEWCRAQSEIGSLIAGVTADNPASIRILEKSGFRLVGNDADESNAERIYELRLR